MSQQYMQVWVIFLDSVTWFSKSISIINNIDSDDLMIMPLIRSTYGRHGRVILLGQKELIHSHELRAKSFNHLGQHREAITDYDTAISLASSIKNSDINPNIKSMLISSLLRANQFKRAVTETNTALMTETQWSGEAWYGLVKIYSISSTKIIDERDLLASYALQLLRKAIASGFRDREMVATDSDLDPLRARADFRVLLNSLPELAPPPRPAAGTP